MVFAFGFYLMILCDEEDYLRFACNITASTTLKLLRWSSHSKSKHTIISLRFSSQGSLPTPRLCAVGTTATWIQRVFRDTKENIFHYLPSVFHRIEFKYSRSDTFVCALCLTHTANRSQTMFMQQSRGWTFSFIIFHCARRWKCCRDLLLSRLSTCFWIFHAFVGNRIFPF